MAVITSDFHMPRTRAIFDTCFSLAEQQLPGLAEAHRRTNQGAYTPDEGRPGTLNGGGLEMPLKPRFFQLEYKAVPDEGIFPEDVLQARRQREAASLATFVSNSRRWRSLADFHEWLHGEHLCYSVRRQGEFGLPTDVDDKAIASY